MRWLKDEPQLALFEPEQRELPSVEYMAVNARRIINTLPASSRMPFRHTINVYRGCRARLHLLLRPADPRVPGPQLRRGLRAAHRGQGERGRAAGRELEDPAWEGDTIAMGTNTDPYQPAEGHYKLTRGCVEVLSRPRNPFSILTKSSMIVARHRSAGGGAPAAPPSRWPCRSAPTRTRSRGSTEPGAAPPSRRLEAIEQLAEAGLRPAVLMAPILPGISDSEEQIRSLTRSCLDAGADHVTPILLHLRPGVREHYFGWLEQARPELVGLHEDAYRAGPYGLRAGSRAGGRDRPRRGQRASRWMSGRFRKRWRWSKPYPTTNASGAVNPM